MPLAVRRHDYRAGRFTVGYGSCDASTAQSGAAELRACAADADAYAETDALTALTPPAPAG
jgi:hypothetical protein